MHIVMYISTTIEQAEQILDLWIKAGIAGVTILESVGMQKASQHGIREDVGLVFSLNSLFRIREINHRTIFSAVRGEEMVTRLVNVTTEFVGDWSKPDVGVLFVWPLAQAYGIDKGSHT